MHDRYSWLGVRFWLSQRLVENSHVRFAFLLAHTAGQNIYYRLVCFNLYVFPYVIAVSGCWQHGPDPEAYDLTYLISSQKYHTIIVFVWKIWQVVYGQCRSFQPFQYLVPSFGTKKCSHPLRKVVHLHSVKINMTTHTVHDGRYCSRHNDNSSFSRDMR